MDLSKLPKLSETKVPEGSEAEAEVAASGATASAGPDRVQSAGIGGEVWFNAIVGLILILYAPQFGKYLFSLATRQPFHTHVEWTEGPNAGAEVPYTQLEDGAFFSDSSLFLFGVAILISAMSQVVLARRSGGTRLIAWVSFGCMLAATIYGAVAVAVLFHAGDRPLVTLLCIGLGGYILYGDWAQLRAR